MPNQTKKTTTNKSNQNKLKTNKQQRCTFPHEGRKDGRDGKGKGKAAVQNHLWEREVRVLMIQLVSRHADSNQKRQHTDRQKCASLTQGKHTNKPPKSKKTDKRKTDHPPSEPKIETLKHSQQKHQTSQKKIAALNADIHHRALHEDVHHLQLSTHRNLSPEPLVFCASFIYKTPSQTRCLWHNCTMFHRAGATTHWAMATPTWRKLRGGWEKKIRHLVLFSRV